MEYLQQRNTLVQVACSEWDYDPELATNTLVSRWNLVCSRRPLVALADAVYSAGALAAMGIASYFVESVGRKPIIITGVIVLLLSTLGITFADTYIMYVTTRFLNSGGTTAVFVISQALLFEVSTDRRRARTMVIAFAFGDIAAELWFDFSYRLRLRWQHLQAIMLSPTLLMMSAFLVVYESPRWLLYKRHIQEAEAVLLAAARKNGFSPSEAPIMTEKLQEEVANSNLVRVKDPDQPSFNDIRRCTVVMTVTYFSATFAFYGMLQSLVARHQAQVRLSASAASAVWFILLVFVIDRLPRLPLTTVLFAMLGSLSALMSVATEATDVHAVLFIVAKGCSQVTLLMNIILILELFPTPLRCQALCLTFACGRVAAVLASLLQVVRYAGRDDFVLGLMALLAFVSMLVLRCIPGPGKSPSSSDMGHTLDNQKPSSATSLNLEAMKETLEPVVYGKEAQEEAQ
ncbi:hypothetical protein HPB48_010979 [Haemaphysalis longicornis]|uniref:Major facilitator superfamily (MFS) profile domain-containing protein n=1 Tax=Haemaphysalis longicornis TaxID=44386 RepID=A0A9J6GEM9_HAELO|nr:hypothetical protein HPB48_010979 [Haemaphysalis longicornis]